MLALAVVDIPEQDRRIVDTGHGAIVTCSGALESALEDALFIALTVRDEVLNSNSEGANPIYLLIGINLGSVKVSENANVNEPDQIVGEGLVEAQRIMSFANPNQILVSRAYYDMASKLTLEIAQMFEKYDMHAYEHDIYAVRLLSEKAASVESVPTIPGEIIAEETGEEKSGVNWGIYILPMLLAIAMLYALTKWMQSEENGDAPIEPALTESMTQEAEPMTDETELVSEDALLNQAGIAEDETKEDEVGDSNEPIQKSAKKKAVKKQRRNKRLSQLKRKSSHINRQSPLSPRSQNQLPRPMKSLVGISLLIVLGRV